MKVFALFLVVLAVLGSALGLKDPVCGLRHALDGNGLIACAAFVPSWSYNSGTNECVEFVYGGCGGNKNRFGTQQECEEMCKE